MINYDEIQRLSEELSDHLIVYKNTRDETARRKCISAKNKLFQQAELLQAYLSENPDDEKAGCILRALLPVLICFKVSDNFKPVEVH